MSEAVILSAYTEAWPRIFEEEASKLRDALAGYAVCDLEHVGSTAIPGMIAKPVIDIMASVEDINKVPRGNDHFWVALGYEWGHSDDDDAADWLYFIKRDNTGRRLIHLHIVPDHSDFRKRTIVFRDALRADQTKAQQYAHLKMRLAETFRDDRLAYLAGKGDFVAAVVSEERDRVANHLPSRKTIESWPEFTPSRPLRMLVSACLAGIPVGFDGSTYGTHNEIAEIIALPNVKAVTFCPEDFAFGTPRDICDIQGGDGHDVLAGRARVVSAVGEDWTDRMIEAAQKMLRIAHENACEVAVLMDISAACGSQVIYAGARPEARYQSSQGVCAALLIESGIPVISQRDFKTLYYIKRKLQPQLPHRDDLRDHHESEWYRNYFGLTN